MSQDGVARSRILEVNRATGGFALLAPSCQVIAARTDRSVRAGEGEEHGLASGFKRDARCPVKGGKSGLMPLIRDALLLALSAALVAGVHATAFAASSLEYAIKATYLLKLAPFVEWPGTVPSDFNICVIGRDPFGGLLQRAAAGQTIDGHPVQVQVLGMITGPSGCQVMYIAGSDSQSVAAALQQVRGQPVLTVTDSQNDPAAKGIINFVIDEDRVRFEIDNAAASAGGLRISSKLLSIAVHVRTQGG